MKIRELRQNLAKVLDDVDNGEIVQIERGDSVYYITNKQPIKQSEARIWDKLLDIEAFLEDALTPVDAPEIQKNSLATPKGMVKITPKFDVYDKSPMGSDANAMPCCSMAKPCKHWEWDGLTDKWKNKISGRARDVE